MRTKQWRVDVYISERDDDTTHAEARLTTGTGTLHADGVARRDPHDSPVPEIGDELATARALSALGQRLLRTTAEDIEAITHEVVHLHD